MRITDLILPGLALLGSAVGAWFLLAPATPAPMTPIEPPAASLAATPTAPPETQRATAAAAPPVQATPALAPAAPFQVMQTPASPPVILTLAKGSIAWTANGPRATLTVDGVRQDFVRIDAGRFTCGSPAGERDRRADERPFTATLSRNFWMADSKCTNGLWTAATGEPTGPATLPRAAVSWSEAQSFATALNTRMPNGVRLRLPTEA
jgi:formylglycine-generating enzyme required for sulfatase activity